MIDSSESIPMDPNVGGYAPLRDPDAIVFLGVGLPAWP